MNRDDVEFHAEPGATRDPRLEIPEVLRTPVQRPESMQATSKSKEGGLGFLGIAKAWGTALDFLFTIFAGAALGWLFDKWQGTAPKGLMIGCGLGFVLAFIRIVRSTMKQERKEREAREAARQPRE